MNAGNEMALKKLVIERVFANLRENEAVQQNPAGALAEMLHKVLGTGMPHPDDN